MRLCAPATVPAHSPVLGCSGALTVWIVFWHTEHDSTCVHFHLCVCVCLCVHVGEVVAVVHADSTVTALISTFEELERNTFLF